MTQPASELSFSTKKQPKNTKKKTATKMEPEHMPGIFQHCAEGRT